MPFDCYLYRIYIHILRLLHYKRAWRYTRVDDAYTGGGQRVATITVYNIVPITPEVDLYVSYLSSKCSPKLSLDIYV